MSTHIEGRVFNHDPKAMNLWLIDVFFSKWRRAQINSNILKNFLRSFNRLEPILKGEAKQNKVVNQQNPSQLQKKVKQHLENFSKKACENIFQSNKANMMDFINTNKDIIAKDSEVYRLLKEILTQEKMQNHGVGQIQRQLESKNQEISNPNNRLISLTETSAPDTNNAEEDENQEIVNSSNLVLATTEKSASHTNNAEKIASLSNVAISSTEENTPDTNNIKKRKAYQNPNLSKLDELATEESARDTKPVKKTKTQTNLSSSNTVISLTEKEASTTNQAEKSEIHKNPTSSKAAVSNMGMFNKPPHAEALTAFIKLLDLQLRALKVAPGLNFLDLSANHDKNYPLNAPQDQRSSVECN
jgi:hypothetical protein